MAGRGEGQALPHCPVFDRLQCAKMKKEGLRTFITQVMSMSTRIDGGGDGSPNERVHCLPMFFRDPAQLYFVNVQCMGSSQQEKDPYLEEDDESDTDSICSDISTTSSMGGEMTSTLYVGKFPPFIKKEQISDHFSDYGFGDNVTRVTIFYDKTTHKSRGCGIVVMTPASIGESAARKLNGTLLCGKHRIVVRLYQRKRRQNAKKRTGAKSISPLSPDKRSFSGKLVGLGTSSQSSPFASQSRTVDSDEESVSSVSGEFCKVFVNSSPQFPNYVNSNHLQKHFSQYKGEIVNARIIRDQETKETKGYGIVTFSSLSAAEAAIQKMNGSCLHGKFTIKLHSDREHSGRKRQPAVSPSLPPLQAASPQKQLPSYPLQDSDDSDNESVSSTSGEACKIFVTSTPPLTNSVNSRHLHDHFSEFGLDIMNIRVIRNRKTKQTKGFAFITFSSSTAASNAIQAKNGSMLLGKHKLRIEFERGSIGGRRESQPSPDPHPQVQEMRRASGPKGISVTDVSTLSQQSSIQPPNPQLYLPQPASTTIVVENLNPVISDHEIKAVMGVPIFSCTFETTGPDSKRVTIQCQSPSDAATAVAKLNGRQLLGHIAHAFLAPTALPSLPSPPSIQPNPQHKPMTYPVKVTHLAPTVTEEKLQIHFSAAGEVVNCKIHHTKNTYAHVNFKDEQTALRAVAMLNGSFLDGWKINVSPKFGKTPPPAGPPPPQLQPTAGVPFQYSSPPDVTPGSATVMKLAPAKQQLPQPIADTQTGFSEQEKQIMKLGPDQWNKLMNVGPHGASIFQELIGPFKSNPNVTIQPQIDQLSIHFVGVHDAVQSAYKHIANQLNKELPVPERVKMTALLELHPNLPSDISQKHHVSVSGYLEGSSAIRFEGPPASIEAARAEVDRLLCQSLITELDIPFPSVLLASLKKKLQVNGIQAHVSILPQSAVSKPTICSFSKDDHEQAIQVLRDGPCEKLVSVNTQDVLDQIKAHPDHNFAKLSTDFSVAIHTTANTIAIQGFLPRDVQSVKKLLSKVVKEHSVKRVPLSCTSEQATYLKHVLIDHPNEETRSLVTNLCADVSYSKGKIFLSGSPETVEEACSQVLSGPLLAGLQIRLFPFTCHFKFLSQIEQYVLKPFQDRNLDFIYATEVLSNPSKGHGKQERIVSKPDEQSFTITIFSREPVVFEKVCLSLEPLAPKSRHFPVRPRALECVKNELSKFEQKYHVRLLSQLKEGSASIIIHGLTTEEVEQCWEEIRELISSNLVVVRHIPIDIYQAKYLQQKYASELGQLKAECMELQLPPTRDSASFKRDDNLSIKIKGVEKQVETVRERIMELIGPDFTVDTFEVTCQPKYRKIWVKRWNDVKKEQEAHSDVIIEFSQPCGRNRRSSNTSDDSEPEINFSFAVFGSDLEEVKEVRDVICTHENGHLMDQKQISLTQEATVALLRGMSSKELRFSQQVNIDVDKKANQVILSSPHRANDDLDATEEEIQRFIGNHTTTSKDITCEDPVVGLVLNSRTMSVRYLSTANTVAKPHNVSVRPLKKPRIGLLVRGSQAAIQTVEPLIQASVIKPIQENVSQLQINIDRIYTPLLTSREFKALDDKLQEDLCVLFSYPRVGKQSEALRSILIQPSSSSHCLKFEVCKGNLVLEQVDAIVNAANEDLKHYGGLAKAILDAGGSAIQTECDSYVRLHGKLRAENAVCLEAGNLPCRKIIHAVGPRWKGGRQNEEYSLYFTIYNVLSIAEKENIGSVAFPAISTGIFGVPEDICARASMKAVRDYCQANPTSNIHTVRFVLFTQSVVDTFLDFFDSGVFDSCIVQSSANVGSSPVSSHSWLWENDRGSFTHYPSDVASRLTREFAQNPRGAVKCLINGNFYYINFPTMTQINTSTGYQRRVQRASTASTVSEAPKSIQWYFTDDKGLLSPYTPADSKAIENMYQSNAPHHLVINNSTYSFDFNRMCQINTRSNYRRAIQRKEEQSASVTQAETETPEQEVQVTPQKKDLVVLLRGPKENLSPAKAMLEEKLKSSFQTRTISLPPVLTAGLEKKLKQIAKKHNATFTFEEQAGKDGKPRKALKLKGLQVFMHHAISAMQEEIINHQLSSAPESETEHPPEWQPQSQTTELFPLTPGTAEWNRVEQQFKQTMTNQIAKISRIQNTWLWEKYVMHRKRLSVKNEGNINEKELFHGTRGNDPRQIYEGEDGFDMRFSAQGMWGQANYFAVNASYSHGYAHPTPDGHREMFLVKVLTGDSCNCPSNNSLRMPPVKQTSGGGRKVQFAQMRYDTVTGTTGGSQVFMTYDNDKAYPAYLIKYKVDRYLGGLF